MLVVVCLLCELSCQRVQTHFLDNLVVVRNLIEGKMGLVCIGMCELISYHLNGCSHYNEYDPLPGPLGLIKQQQRIVRKCEGKVEKVPSLVVISIYWVG